MPISCDVIGVVGHGAPWMSVPTDLAIAVSVVQQYEFFCDFMVVRSDFARKHAQARIPVAFRGRLACHVPKDLVVGSILFDHIDHVFDRGRIANSCRNDRWPGRVYRRKEFVGVGAVLIDLLSVLLQLLIIGKIND